MKVYVLVNNLAVVPNVWTFNFTQYHGLHGASGSPWKFTGNFDTGTIPSLSPGEIPVEFPARIMLRSHVVFAGISSGIRVIFSRWNPS